MKLKQHLNDLKLQINDKDIKKLGRYLESANYGKFNSLIVNGNEINRKIKYYEINQIISEIRQDIKAFYPDSESFSNFFQNVNKSSNDIIEDDALHPMRRDYFITSKAKGAKVTDFCRFDSLIEKFSQYVRNYGLAMDAYHNYKQIGLLLCGRDTGVVFYKNEKELAQDLIKSLGMDKKFGLSVKKESNIEN